MSEIPSETTETVPEQSIFQGSAPLVRATMGCLLQIFPVASDIDIQVFPDYAEIRRTARAPNSGTAVVTLSPAPEYKVIYAAINGEDCTPRLSFLRMLGDGSDTLLAPVRNLWTRFSVATGEDALASFLEFVLHQIEQGGAVTPAKVNHVVFSLVVTPLLKHAQDTLPRLRDMEDNTAQECVVLADAIRALIAVIVDKGPDVNQVAFGSFAAEGFLGGYFRNLSASVKK